MDSFLYLLDTDILSDLIKRPQGPVMRRIAACGEDVICTSIIVASELRFGAEKKRSPSLTAKVEDILSNIEVLPLDIDADQHYADIRAFLKKRGQSIGPNDMLIASHARSIGLIMVSGNSSEFDRIPDLVTENWLVDL